MNIPQVFQFTGMTMLAFLFLAGDVSAQTANRKTIATKEVVRKAGEPTPAKRPTAQPVSATSEISSKAEMESVKVLAPKPAATKESAPKSDIGEMYKLTYKLKKNEKIVSEVTHLATTNTKINDVSQASQSRTVSRKVWEVTSVEPSGNMTFTHTIDSVDMSQQVGDAPEVRYNSKTDKDPPSAFQSVSETIGKPLATITISPWGEVMDRSEKANGTNLGMGDITIPMPQEAIGLGQQWETAREIRVRRTDGTPKMVKVRELYTLEKVSAGVAVISIRSEPLTPLHEPELEAQAIQQMSNGDVRFDLDAGRLISKSLAWDKSIVGFSGPGSVMDYSARLDEKVQ